MNADYDDVRTRRWPWWANFLLVLIALCAVNYLPPMGREAREFFVAVCATLIAAPLVYSLYRFVRGWILSKDP